MAASKVYYTTGLNKKSVVIVSLTITLVVLIVIAGLLVRFLVPQPTRHVVLIVLIVALVLIGIFAVLSVHLIKNVEQKKNPGQGRPKIVPLFEYKSVRPSAPPKEGETFSNRSTLQAESA